MKIPLFLPWINNNDKKIMLSTLNSPNLTDGPKLEKFERVFSNKVGCKYSIGVSNGTAALHLALKSMGITLGDEVILPDMTFVATANAVILCGAKPVLANIESSLNISPESIKKRINKRTKAIIPVHFAGLSCKMDKIMSIARKNNLIVIEDCAHSLGSKFNEKHVGTFGNAGCFSFYPTKNITTIEGGMVITNSKEISNKMKQLRNHGLTRNLIQRSKNEKPWIYDIEEPGYNYRLDEVRSSLGLSQINRFDNITKKRVNAAKYYNKKFQNEGGIEVVNHEYENVHVYHMYIIRIKPEFGISRDSVHKKLFTKGIKTTVHYKPLHLFSNFKKFKLKNSQFIESSKAYKECLTIPLYPTISKKEQDYVIDNLLKLRK